MSSLSPQRNNREDRPSPNNRHPTAPSIMTVNGHFANVGEKPTKEQYEHGIQVIDEDQVFKYGFSRFYSKHAHTLIYYLVQPKSSYLLVLRESRAGWFQLPSYFCVWLAINRQVDIAQPSIWHGVWCDVRVGQKANDQGNMDV